MAHVYFARPVRSCFGTFNDARAFPFAVSGPLLFGALVCSIQTADCCKPLGRHGMHGVPHATFDD